MGSRPGDFATIAERSKKHEVRSGKLTLTLAELREIHAKVLQWIAETIRWGYVQNNGATPERVGSREQPIVSLDAHEKFVSALFKSQAGVSERRRAFNLFTTNYDTLFEDALALGRIPY